MNKSFNEMFHFSKLSYFFSHDSQCFKYCKILILTFTRHKSHYSSLGVDSSASLKEIKTAYYKLSFIHHPDKNNNDAESIKKFREITEAYETLSCPRKKIEYDKSILRPKYYTDVDNMNDWDDRPKAAKYSGRTREYDYDEHFRRHYEERMRAEHEYFKMRWKAYSGRYDTSDEYFRQRSKERAEFYKHFERKRVLHIKRSFVFLITLWSIYILFNGLSYWYEADRPRKALYYDIEKKNVSEKAN